MSDIKSLPSVPSEVLKSVQALAESQSNSAKSVTATANSSTSTTGTATVVDKWKVKKGSITPLASLGSSDGLNKVVNGLEEVIDLIEVTISIVKATGKIINAFQTDVNNVFTVLSTLVQAVVTTLQEWAVSLSSTGIYALPMMPDTSPFDPSTPAGGGFKAVKAKVNHALTNKKDPNRPVFFEGDYLGACVFVCTAGTNAGNIIKDLSILARFFQGDEVAAKVSPVQNLTATPGLYTKLSGEVDNLLGDLGSSLLGVREPGIKVSWSEPIGVPNITGYNIYRSKTAEGTPELDEDGNLVRVPSDSPFNAGRKVTSYIDYTFNGGKPVFVKNSSIVETDYLDWEVIDGEVYYYKVVPVLDDSNGNKVEGEVISQFTSAKASSCIPSDLLEDMYETPDGLLRGKVDGDPPYWKNVTLRGLMGDSLDAALRYTQGLADRLKGVTVSSSDHFNNFIETLEDWVATSREFLERLKNILESLQAIQFSSDVMMLFIPAEDGGIEGLKARINNAGFNTDMQEYFSDVDNNCTIYGGAMFVVGAVRGSPADKVKSVYGDSAEALKKSGHLEQAKIQIAAELKGLEDKVGDEDSTPDKSEEVMKLLINLLGG